MTTLEHTSVRAEAHMLREQLVAWRRDFHRNPELAFEEHRSARIIAAHLRDLGYLVHVGVATTGVVAVLEGSRPGPVVMFRFDMDALPIAEESGRDYASQNAGVMHACGHDGHMAIGLSVATVMAKHSREMSGTLKLVFQPAEEDGDGAVAMIAEGVLENPRPDVFLAAHLWNDKPVGTVNVVSGGMMAGSSEWVCTVQGRGGHGATPHQTVDPVVAAALIVTALQTVVSRDIDPLEPAVVTVGTIHGGDARNIIPDRVELSGTLRAYTPQVMETVLSRVRDIVIGVAAASGATADLRVVSETPPVVNDQGVAEVVRAAARAVVGPTGVLCERVAFSEDAAFFLQEVPGCCFLVGSADPERGLDVPHHNPRFDFDEDALPLATAVMVEAAARYL